MNCKEELIKVREKIDDIDAQLMQLFETRMRLSEDVAKIKGEGNISLVDEKRENEVVKAAVEKVELQSKGEAAVLMRSLMALSKIRQRKCLYGENGLERLLPAPRKPITENVKVAYQGVSGAWTEVAAIKLFPDAERTGCSEWEDVFAAVKEKKVHYGVLPVENSQTGAIGEVYDLLRKYGCYIVGQTWVPVKQCLMAVKGTVLSDIKEVYSHPQGFKQCGKFLREYNWEHTVCQNTATAAKRVAEKGDKHYAAIGSARAAEINGLEVLCEDITAENNNKTRFIVIADAPEYTEKSNAVSVIFRTAHRSGALVDVLFPFMSENVNLSRLESRPLADGKYCFFTDVQGNIEDENVVAALRQANSSCGFMEILGCYTVEDK